MKSNVATAALSLAILSWLISCAPVSAQTWGYSPYTGNAPWLSLARTLSYPLGRFGGGYSPFYLANSLIYSASYATSQVARGRQRDMYYGQYADEEPFYNQRQRTRPYLSTPSVGDQMVHARRYAPQYADDEQFENIPVSRNGQPDQWINDPTPVIGAVPPPVSGQAPQMVSPPGDGAMPPTAPAMAKPAREPLAAGFVHVVNERFGGNIVSALSDKDTRKYAKSVGLIDSDKLATDKISNEKVDLIRAILGDAAEPASVRLNAVRVLLKH